MKKLFSIMLILVLSVSLMGCTAGDAGLYNAFKNMQEVNVIENNTDINFDLSGEGLGRHGTDELKQISSIINSMQLTLKSKSDVNKEGTAALAESEMNIDFMGMNIPLKGWSEIDLERSEMLMISNIPQIALGLIGAPMETDVDDRLVGKEYIINDLGAMMQAEGEEVDFKEMLEFQKEIQPNLIKLMEKIEKDLNLDSEIIKLEEEKEIDGEKIKIYRLKLNDKSLRAVLKDLVNYGLENESTREFVVEYINGYENTMKKMDMSDELSQEDLKKSGKEIEGIQGNLDVDLNMMKEKFNKTMEKYKEIKILGKDGINILYSVNEDGYVIEKDGVIDFSINLTLIDEFKRAEEIEEIIEKSKEFKKLFPLRKMKGRVNLKVKFKSVNSNINSEELIVTLPELTSENSLTIEEMMEEIKD